ncbi:MAG TPA: rhodanese-like domain-containing protein [Bacteroidetes bacterium]|nr:rhodanese-like domain-containing protein [Bacteroidota bacterium]
MSKLLYLIPFMFLFIVVGKSQSSNTQKVVAISAEKFKNMAETGRYPIIDIRTAREFEAGHIKGAINIDFYKKSFYGEMQKYKDKPFLFYCRSGNRTGHALRKFREMGFKEAYELDKGIIVWKRLNYSLAQ